MKFRTCLLAVCMVVVPALAMFSHLIPAAARRSARDCVMAWWSPPRGAGSPVHTSPEAVAGRQHEPVAGAGVDVSAAAPPDTRIEGVPPPRDESLRRLSHLGAVAIECVALPGVAGRHVASCQMPLDPQGQLHRVFQMEGTDADAAALLLLNDVVEWRRRVATRTAGAAEEASQGTAGRF